MTPAQIKSLYAKAQAAQKAGRIAEAEKAYGRILKANPRVAEVHFNLGRIGAARGQIAGAAQHFEAALKLKPTQPEIWLAYLEMASHHPNISNLEKLIKRSGSSVEKFADLGFYKGLIAARTGQPDAAIDQFNKAHDAGFQTVRLLTERGLQKAELGDAEGALADLDAAVALNPLDDMALERRAALLRDLGDSEAALAAARQAIEAAPKRGTPYLTYASIAKMRADDPIISRMEELFKRTKSSDLGKVQLGHALSKAMEETGRHEEVFAYLDAANRQLAKAFPYDHSADVAAVEASNAVFDTLSEADLDQARPSKGPVPIFVTGLPRSGTTLVEQILAAHSECAGGGELSLLGKPLLEAITRYGKDADALSEALRDAGAQYLETLAQRFKGAAHVTDKSISSYNLIGFIRHALPQARIVVVRRDPGDNAMSIYKNLFPLGTHRYAASLTDIARFMRLFETQIAFWERRMPRAFSSIRYEELIADPETLSRDLVAAAGLEWQEACLSFHKAKRTVKTLSSAQVRQPIYASSVGASSRHDAAMAPFWQTYGDSAK